MELLKIEIELPWRWKYLCLNSKGWAQNIGWSSPYYSLCKKSNTYNNFRWKNNLWSLVWFKPKVNQLRVFGSTCYSLLPKGQSLTKLENQIMKCTFIRYSDEKKVYQYLSDVKFIVNRDILFMKLKVKFFMRLIISLVI
jgi:hypothetical protein